MRKKTKQKTFAFVLCFFLILAFIVAGAEAELKICFLDVGQGDSILIQCDGNNMLIDAGPLEAGTKVNAWLKKNNIEQLDYVIATHEHDDHLFGMPDALRGMKVNHIFTPPAIPLTYWFEQILPGLNQDSLSVTKPNPLDTFLLGNATVTFLNGTVWEAIPNDLSLVIRIDYGDNSALLAADLEGPGEEELLKRDVKLNADVLKIGHHGGNTSTTDAFIRAVNPQYAVISVGKDNKHGHPHGETLKKLEKYDTAVYRTDEFGTVTMTSDGTHWTVEVEKAR